MVNAFTCLETTRTVKNDPNLAIHPDFIRESTAKRGECCLCCGLNFPPLVQEMALFLRISIFLNIPVLILWLLPEAKAPFVGCDFIKY